MDIKEAYELAAHEYRKKYDAQGVRNFDVDKAFSYVNKQNPFVLEIGCAYGRDAKYILTKTNHYLGIDISETFIEMARSEMPKAHFEQADVMRCQFPEEVDIVIAFASLLHLPKEDLATLLKKINGVLEPGGVVFLSLKRRDAYETKIENDALVSRRFYYYTRKNIHENAPPQLKEVYYDEQVLKEPWFTIILQKQ